MPRTTWFGRRCKRTNEENLLCLGPEYFVLASFNLLVKRTVPRPEGSSLPFRTSLSQDMALDMPKWTWNNRQKNRGSVQTHFSDSMSQSIDIAVFFFKLCTFFFDLGWHLQATDRESKSRVKHHIFWHLIGSPATFACIW